ncbi:MAG: glycerol-3-phosphate 1-O-acyltransferase PlsY [Dehalococcoidia bacterium]
MDILLAAIAGYLLGAIPVGLIVTRLSGGVDVRDYGSGKTGFTNTLRVVGLKRSVPVFVGDFLKGLAAALLPLLWTDDPWARAAGGVAAIVGHAWPVFAGFRGGRGVLAGVGALFGLNPLAALIVVPVMVVCVGATRYVSLGSITAAFTAGVVFLALAALNQQSWAYGVAAALGAALIIALHHDNIGRLLAGTERKLGKGGDRRVAPPTA